MARVEENFEEALLPAEYVPTLSEDLDLIGKIAITVIRDVVTKNHLEALYEDVHAFTKLFDYRSVESEEQPDENVKNSIERAYEFLCGEIGE